MAVKAVCPAYITGIFTIGNGDAAGAGFAIDRMLSTTVSEKKSGSTSITINGAMAPTPVSKAVLRRFTEAGAKPKPLEIRHETEIPIGYGLGMSAAGALSLSLALNELLGCGFSREKCVKIAHDSDVECGTGLSGVDAANVGGILFRKSLEDRPVAIKFEEHELDLAFFSPIRTSSITRSEDWRAKVNEAGTAALGELSKKKSWGAFVEASRHFTMQSGLGNWCGAEMEANPRASMAMLGQTLFSDKPLSLSRYPLKTLKASICREGAGLA
ncbi:Pantoate kinase [uncultured archaeon]|nr:Pantoate kinase [uncultured archaeon]